MKITVDTSLSRQDFPEADNWISNLLYPLQVFMTAVKKCLTNNVTLQDNMSCIVQTVTFTAGALDIDNTFTFQYTLPRKPVEFNYFCVATNGTYPVVYPQISWNLINTNIVVNGVKGLTPGVQYTFTITVK